MCMKRNVFQRLSATEYEGSRLAPKLLFKELIHHIVDNELNYNQPNNILVIGCHNGERDLIPFCNRLEEKVLKKDFHIYIVDDTDAAEELYHKLEKEKGKKMKLSFYKDRIEDFSANHEYINFNVIIAFSVFHHLYNWQETVISLFSKFNSGAKFFTVQHDDNLTKSIENNLELDSCIKEIKDFHKYRFDYCDVKYYNNLLGTNYYNMLRFLAIEFDNRLVKSVKSPFTIERKISSVLSKKAYYSPFSWGQKIDLHIRKGKIAHWLKQVYKEKIDYYLQSNDRDVKYCPELSLFKLEKKENSWIELKNNIYDFNYRDICSAIDKDTNDSENLQRSELLFLQQLIGYNAVSKSTKIVTSVYRNIKTNGKIDNTIEGSSFATIIQTENLDEYLMPYLTHIALYTLNDSTKENEDEKFTLASILDSLDIDLIFQKTEGEFDCEIIENDSQKYLVSYIPTKYLVDKDFVFEIDLEGEGIWFNNYTHIDMRGLLLEVIKEKIYDEGVFNEIALANDREIIYKRYYKTLSKSSLFEDNRAKDIARFLSFKSPRFAYLTQLGTWIYFLNKVKYYNLNSTGGLFNCEDDFDVNQLRSGQNIISQRFKFIKDSITYFSFSHILPKLNSVINRIEQEKTRSLTLGEVFHKLRQPLAGLDIIANDLQQLKHSEKADLIRYLRNTLTEYLEVSKYLSDQQDEEIEIEDREISLSELTYNLVKILLDCVRHPTLIRKTLRFKNHQNEGLKKAVGEGKLICGNFDEVTLTKAHFPIGVPSIIIKESLVNAIEHSFYKEPRIQVNLFESSDEFKIEITNNVCVSMEQLNEMYNPKGAKKRGMAIINSLVEKVGWRKKYLRNAKEGTTTYQFIIPRK